jgi:hypothetical protein
VKIRSKAVLREAIIEGIKEFHRKNNRMDAINGNIEIRLVALGIWLDLDRFMEKGAYTKLFEELNRDKSIIESVKQEKKR